jgi:hypothetical protein
LNNYDKTAKRLAAAPAKIAARYATVRENHTVPYPVAIIRSGTTGRHPKKRANSASVPGNRGVETPDRRDKLPVAAAGPAVALMCTYRPARGLKALPDAHRPTMIATGYANARRNHTLPYAIAIIHMGTVDWHPKRRTNANKSAADGRLGGPDEARRG